MRCKLEIVGLSCYECGSMNDGAAFMGIKGFQDCQFFEHDVAANKTSHIKQCPPHDRCCFSLREHMSIRFWGRKYYNLNSS